MLSYWEKQSFFDGIDIVIVGSGIVGLNAAICLKEHSNNLNVVVIERGFLPYGASTRNAGFACFGSISELIDDLENSSEDEVFALVERRFKGLSRLRERVGDEALRYENLGGFEIFKKEEKDIFNVCHSQLDYFNKQVKNTTKRNDTYRILSKKEVNNFGFEGIDNAILNQSEGQINTGEMMKTLLAIAQEKGIRIINGLNVEKIIDEGAKIIFQAENWHFQAKKALICTNGFARQLLPDIEVTAARNQVIITKPIPNLSLKGCFHYDRGYFYFRNIDNRILLGGGRNLDYITEKTDAFGTSEIIQNALKDLLQNTILPQKNVDIDMTWSGIMGLGSIKKPIIQMHSKNLAIAVRMGGMGVAIGSLVGEDGAEMMIKNL